MHIVFEPSPFRSFAVVMNKWIYEFAIHVIRVYDQDQERSTRTRIHEDLQKPVRTFYVFGVVQRPAKIYKGPRRCACVVVRFTAHEDLHKPVMTFYVFGIVQRPARTCKGPRGRACIAVRFARPISGCRRFFREA